MMAGIAQKTWPTARFFLAWVFLNVLLNLDYPALEVNLWASLGPPLEIAMLLLTLCAAVWGGMSFRRGLYLALLWLVPHARSLCDRLYLSQ